MLVIDKLPEKSIDGLGPAGPTGALGLEVLPTLNNRSPCAEHSEGVIVLAHLYRVDGKDSEKRAV